MFACLQAAFRDLDDKSGIDEAGLRFSGFDGNTAGKQLGYVRYNQEVKGYHWSFVDEMDDLNSHCPMLDGYRSMLREWKRSDDRNELTKEDIRRITQARRE